MDREKYLKMLEALNVQSSHDLFDRTHEMFATTRSFLECLSENFSFNHVVEMAEQNGPEFVKYAANYHALMMALSDFEELYELLSVKEEGDGENPGITKVSRPNQ